MAETATLTTPIDPPTRTTYAIVEFAVSTEVPYLKATVKFNDGTRFAYNASLYRTPAQITTGLSYINQGKFQTLESKSMQKWLIEQIMADVPELAGTVSGTPT